MILFNTLPNYYAQRAGIGISNMLNTKINLPADIKLMFQSSLANNGTWNNINTIIFLILKINLINMLTREYIYNKYAASNLVNTLCFMEVKDFRVGSKVKDSSLINVLSILLTNPYIEIGNIYAHIHLSVANKVNDRGLRPLH